MADRPVCACHGEPMYPNNSVGGWRCAIKDRIRYERRRDIKNQRMRERYDADPIYRIEKRLRDDARQRALRLQRRKETAHGPLPDQG